MEIPIFDLKCQYQFIGEEIEKEVIEVLRSTQYILGPKVKKFEEEFARWSNSNYCIGTNSGSSALIVAIRALELPSNSEILCPSLTYFASPASIVNAGHIPVFVDSDEYYNISVRDLEEKVTQWTRAILIVHLYGQPANMDAIRHIAKKYSLKIIGDNAQSQGALYNGINVNNFEDISATSFYPGKNLGACGDAGAVLTNSKDLYDKCIAIRNDGRLEGAKYEHMFIGGNYRMPPIQAVALSVKLRYLTEWNNQRKEIVKLYNQLLSSLYLPIQLPEVREGVDSVYHQYVIRVKNRDEVQRKLLEKGISTNIHYPIANHLQKAFIEYNKNDCPMAEIYTKEVLSLPLFPELTNEEVIEVVNRLKEVLRNE